MQFKVWIILYIYICVCNLYEDLYYNLCYLLILYIVVD